MPIATVDVTNLYAKCLPRFAQGTNRCEGLTLMEVSPTTPAEFASIYTDEDNKWRVMGALLGSDFVGKACQIRQNSLYDFIIATARTIDQKKISVQSLTRDLWEVMPFIKMKRTGIINANYWNVTNGVAEADTGPNGGVYTHRFDMTSQTGIPADVGWFSDRSEFTIRGKNTGTGVTTTTSWKVVDQEVIGLVVRVYVVSLNLNSSFPAGALQVPPTGLAFRGVPNVNDYESYCKQIPSISANQRAVFWIKTTRWTVCMDKMTEDLINLLRANNPEYAEFGDVTAVEYNKQIIQDFQSRMINEAFFAKPYPNQTITDYPLLEEITAADATYPALPGVFGRVIGRRANSVGWYEQLRECGRVRDLGNEVLNIQELKAELYRIRRVRRDNGIEANIIELVTNSSYAVALYQGFFNDLNNQLQGTLRVNLDWNEITKVLPGGFTFMDIKLTFPSGLIVRIVTHEAFDDLRDAQAAANPAQESSGNMILIMDWVNTVYLSVLASNSVMNKTADQATLSSLDNGLMCVMKIPQQSISMKSLTFATIVECPAANLWMENIAPGVPEHCGPVGDATDLKGAVEPEA